MPRMPNYDGEFFDAGRKYFEDGLEAWKGFVIDVLEAKSIADFGCGQGDWLEPLEAHMPVWGCDGFANEQHLRIQPQNFRKVSLGDVLPSELDVGPRDVVISLEAMEHVTTAKETAFLDCMLSPEPRLVVFGVASGWGTYDFAQTKVNRLGEVIHGGNAWHAQYGRHHVACQPVALVIEKMKSRGYVIDDELSMGFASLRVPGKGRRTKYAFASFNRKNTRVYRKA